MRPLRRIWADLRARRHVDTYVATAVAAAFAVLGVVGDVVPENVKWSAVFAGIGVLLYRVALPDRPARPVDGLLADRSAFEDVPFPSLIAGATELWIFAPSAVNVLAPQNCEAIRRHVLDKGSGEVRIAVIDPAATDAVALAVRQLDRAVERPVQDFEVSLATTVERLRRMAAWQVAGTFDYRFFDFNPGFSLVAIDPSRRDGRIYVEFHGCHNDAIGSRMHLALTRRDSDRWFDYWVRQFEELWADAHP